MLPIDFMIGDWHRRPFRAILAPGSLPMNRILHSGTSMRAPTLRRALTLAVLTWAGLISTAAVIHAQDSLAASGQNTPTAGPADSFRGAALFNPGAANAASARGSGISAFWRLQTPSIAQPRDLSSTSATWKRWLLDPYQPAAASGNFGGSAAGSIGFMGTLRQSGGGFNRFGGVGWGGPPQDLPALFPSNGNFPRNLASGTNGTAGGDRGTLPRFDTGLDTGMGNSLNLPFNSYVGAFRPSYRDLFGEGMNSMGGNLGKGSASTMFSTSNLGNGMFLSAGSSFGRRSAAGPAPSAALPAGQKHLGPSVGLKLTF